MHRPPRHLLFRPSLSRLGLAAGLLPACLLLVALGAGCETAKSAAAHHQAEGSDDELDASATKRASPMLEKLRESNRVAVRSDQQEDVESMRRELAKVEVDLAQAQPGSEEALAIQAHRDELKVAIQQQERMVKGLGE